MICLCRVWLVSALLLAAPIEAAKTETEQLEFDVPRQRADRALTQFAQKAGMTLVFPFDVASRTETNELVGRYSVEQGLQRLLKGTGLLGVADESGELRIEPETPPGEHKDMTTRSAGFFALIMGFITGGAAAQTPGDAPQTSARLDEITVTARKVDERLQEIPLSISVVTGDDIDRRGYRNLEDLTLAVPGVDLPGSGGSLPGRYNSSIGFRGLTARTAQPTFALGTLFIDGVFVLGSAQSIPFEGIERVEIIKGPQAAYFGRSTFGGAINYITRVPSLTEYSGAMQVSAGSYNDYEAAISHEGPIITDTLSYRIGASGFSRGGMWTASDGGKLGEESSRNINATLHAAPSDRLSIRLRGFYGVDDDGAPAGGYISGDLNDSCIGRTIESPAEGPVTPSRYFCGQVPTQGNAISVVGNTRIIDGTTSLRPAIAGQATGNPDYLIDQFLVLPLEPELSKVPSIDRIGMKRELFRISLAADYELNGGQELSFQGGYNEMHVNWLRDQAVTAIPRTYSLDPQSQDDWSAEVRLRSSQDQRLRWLAGVNQYRQTYISAGGGGRSVFFCWDNPDPNVECDFSRAPLFQTNRLDGTDRVKTTGVFGAVAYDFTDQITLDIEARYQRDELVKATTGTANTLLPRVILQFQPTAETNVYASWSQGVLPGTFNGMVINADAQELAQYAAQGISPFTPQEELDSYEIGWKQLALEGRLETAIAVYYSEWANQKSGSIGIINETCRAVTQLGCNPATGGAPLGEPARNADGSPVFFLRPATGSGSSTGWGVEFESGYRATDNLTLAASVAYASTEYGDFIDRGATRATGFSDMRGNSIPRYPEWSGAVNSVYQAPLAGTGWEWFVLGDVVYRGKTYIDSDNLAYCSGYVRANARAGVENESMRVELWVRNLFDDDNWAACSRAFDRSRPLSFATIQQFQGAVVSPQDKRQVGIKFSMKF